MWPVKFSLPLGSCFPIHLLLPGHTFRCYPSQSVPTLTGLTSGLTPSCPLNPLWDAQPLFILGLSGMGLDACRTASLVSLAFLPISD